MESLPEISLLAVLLKGHLYLKLNIFYLNNDGAHKKNKKAFCLDMSPRPTAELKGCSSHGQENMSHGIHKVIQK